MLEIVCVTGVALLVVMVVVLIDVFCVLAKLLFLASVWCLFLLCVIVIVFVLCSGLVCFG